MIDTHTHLFLPEFESDLDLVVSKAQALGFEALLLPNVDETTLDAMLSVCDRFPSVCFPMMGIHPCSIKDSFAHQIALVKKVIAERCVCAIGEIGLDLYWDKTHLSQQIAAFIEQLCIARDANLPVCIHIRDAFAETFQALSQSGIRSFSGVFHCFSGTADDAQRALDLGFVLGIGGPLTYKKSTLPQAIAKVPLSSIVLETDAPYLAPHPHRGKRNEPALLLEVVALLAELYHVSDDEVRRVTTATAKRVFPL